MPHRITQLLGLCVLALTLAGCGGESFSGASSDKQPKATNPVCAARPAKLNPASRKRVAPNKPARVDLSEVTGGRAGKVEVTVAGAKSPSGVEDVFTDKGRFRPGVSDRLVAVSFTLTNRGASEIEAANTVNDAFVVADAGGNAWLRADGVEACSAISPSAAVSAGDTSPEDDLKPGEKYETTAVYVVPRVAKELSWVGPGVRFPLELR